MEKSNQQRLEEYLVGINGYLKSDISNGKVIMLSGKWGSGKTHFWKNKIQTVLNDNDKDKKIPNHYISLYGKTSIEEIRNEVFLKIFESVDSSKLEEKGTKLAKNTIDLIVSFIKSIDIDGVKIDLSTVSDNSFRQLEKFLKNKKIKKTVEYLNKSAIICFDDFERKSKDIDLNDLFGFITQLTLNFDSKVVIILNDDVFEGEEKKIFSNVKEKSVSKFLKYEPSIKDLFNLIFYGRKEDNKKKFKYLELRKYKQIILKTIKETEELNARIYIQVLDNLVEWIKIQDKSDDVLRCLILVNINFILNHIVFRYDDFYEERKNEELPSIFFRTEDISAKLIRGLYPTKNTNKDELHIKSEFLNHIYSYLDKEEDLHNDAKKYSNLLWNYWRYIIKLESHRNVNDENILRKINNFIETGILINE
ncbi:MAG: P-loop NTPase fold protein [Aliarcobacter sp.]|nr:P-loop NTPase fold protein [Aliarcobacter sp.]